LRISVVKVSDDGYTYYYTHLEPNSTSVISDGRRVKAGDFVGKVGDNAAGDFRGEHLHISAAPTGLATDEPYGDFFLARDVLPVLFGNRNH